LTQLAQSDRVLKSALTGCKRVISRSLLVFAAALAAVSGVAAAAPRPGSVDYSFGDQGQRSDGIGCVPASFAGVERAESGNGIRVIGSTERSSPELAAEGGRLIFRGYDGRGRLDRDVGGTGTRLVRLPAGRARAWGTARQPDGKLVVVGSVGEEPNEDLFVARFYPDGSLDGEFGNGGVVATDLGALAGVVGDVVVQPDGRIVVAASGVFESGATYVTRSTDLVVLRYLSDGPLDPGFASGGVLHVTSGSSESYFFARGLGLARDGTILVGGERGLSYRLDSNVATIARVRSDGSLDTMVGVPGDWREVGAMSVDKSRRRIYLAGSMPRVRDGEELVMSVAAIRQRDLSLDRRFGAQGIARADFPHTDYDFPAAVMSDRRGRVVLAGGAATVPPGRTARSAPRSRFGVVRFTAAGGLDRRFGRGGVARVGFPYRQSVAYGVLEQPARRLVLAGIGANSSTEVRPASGCALALTRLAAR
jgi:uncharacterized delta-60 repeat protein